MMVAVGSEAGEIVFQKEYPEEFRIPYLHRDVPGCSYNNEQEHAGNPECLEKNSRVFREDREHDDNCARKKRGNWPFRQSSQGEKNIECPEKPPLRRLPLVHAKAIIAASTQVPVSSTACTIRTAVQTEELPSLNRVRKADKVLARIRPLIESAQRHEVPETQTPL